MNNLAILQRDCKSLAGIVNRYQQLDELAVVSNTARDADGRWQQATAELREEAERIDLPYTLQSLDGLIVRSRDGLARIQQIVHDLRGFSREEAAEETEANANLNSGIETAMALVKGRASKKQVTLEADLSPLPGVTCETAKVNQVIFNLLLNAIDASLEGGIVTVRSRPTPEGVEVQVVDHGVGIRPEILPKIFDPFFTTKPPGQGTGLGLSVSYAIVAEHGGKIEVDSQLGRGSCFTVCLPLAPPATGAASPL
jgi:signal transduction histidine kinase